MFQIWNDTDTNAKKINFLFFLSPLPHFHLSLSRATHSLPLSLTLTLSASPRLHLPCLPPCLIDHLAMPPSRQAKPTLPLSSLSLVCRFASGDWCGCWWRLGLIHQWRSRLVHQWRSWVCFCYGMGFGSLNLFAFGMGFESCDCEW